MRYFPGSMLRLFIGAVLVSGVFLSVAAGGASARGGLPPAPGPGPTASAISRCPSQNAEVEQAVDGHYVYEEWIGCTDGHGGNGIGFARSTDGGRTFGPT